MKKLLAASVVALASMLQIRTGASAALLNIAAVTFTEHTTSYDGDRVIEGMLGFAFGKYYAPVVFPSGGKVCRLYLAFRDNDVSGDVSARLLRKVITPGGSAFTSPVLMPAVTSRGANDKTQRRADTTIAQPAIDQANSVYYVELIITGRDIEIIGVQIDFRSSACTGDQNATSR